MVKLSRKLFEANYSWLGGPVVRYACGALMGASRFADTKQTARMTHYTGLPLWAASTPSVCLKTGHETSYAQTFLMRVPMGYIHLAVQFLHSCYI